MSVCFPAASRHEKHGSMLQLCGLLLLLRSQRRASGSENQLSLDCRWWSVGGMAWAQNRLERGMSTCSSAASHVGSACTKSRKTARS